MRVFSKHSWTQQPHMIRESYLEFNNFAASLGLGVLDNCSSKRMQKNLSWIR